MCDTTLHGALTRRMLADVGIDKNRCARLVASGDLLRVGPGIFLRLPRPVDTAERWWQDCAVALLRAGPNAVLSRQAAAVAHGLDGFDAPVPITVNVPRTDGHRGPGVHRVTRIGDVGEARRLPVCSPAQTLVELGADLPPRRVTGNAGRMGALLGPDDLTELAVECALRRQIVDEADLRALTCTGSRRRGAAVLAAVMARRPAGTAATESYLETRGIQVLRAAGLPTGVRQHAVHDDHGRFVARVDLLLADRVVIEFDGRAFHGDDRFDADRRRWNRLGTLGYRLAIFTYEQVEFEPGYVARTVTRLLT